MDSLSQLALGSAVALASLGRVTRPWKAALWGGIAGTLPDLDVLLDHGDPISNMVLHRAESHALFWLTLASPILALVASSVHGERERYGRWLLALWLALVTHPLLDALTVYGTRLWLPFSDHPVGVGSVFIIDPLYTLPLLFGVVLALAVRDRARGSGWNRAGLVLSTAYLAWTVAAQTYVASDVRASLRAQGLPAAHVLVTPTPFNSILWRVVVLDGARWHEGFVSLLDGDGPLVTRAFPRDESLDAVVRRDPRVSSLVAFTKGYYRVIERDGAARIADVRMGQEPHFVFEFAVARREGQGWRSIDPELVGSRGDLGAAWAWTWTRLRGIHVPHPR